MGKFKIYDRHQYYSVIASTANRVVVQYDAIIRNIFWNPTGYIMRHAIIYNYCARRVLPPLSPTWLLGIHYYYYSFRLLNSGAHVVWTHLLLRFDGFGGGILQTIVSGLHGSAVDGGGVPPGADVTVRPPMHTKRTRWNLNLNEYAVQTYTAVEDTYETHGYKMLSRLKIARNCPDPKKKNPL